MRPQAIKRGFWNLVKKADVASVFETGKTKTYKPDILPSNPKKVIEHLVWETITRHIEYDKATWIIKYGSTNGKSDYPMRSGEISGVFSP